MVVIQACYEAKRKLYFLVQICSNLLGVMDTNFSVANSVKTQIAVLVVILSKVRSKVGSFADERT